MIKPDSSQRQSDSNEGITILSLLIAGIAFYGLLGWLLDNWLGTHWLLPVGLVAGMILSFYVVIKKYGSVK